MTEPAKTTERLLWALQERAKELNCLYQVEELLNDTDASLEGVFRGVIRALPPGWQYPDVCQAEVEYEGQRYRSEGFVEMPWVQRADIVVQDRAVGSIAVSYREEMPQADDGPFLKEEDKLIRTVADRLGHFILHQRLRDVFRELHRAETSLAERGSQEWRIVLDLLRRTDQELFVRLSRKMANHLSWSGFAEAQSLLHGLGQEARGGDGSLGEKNQPIERLPIDSSLPVADQVFALAGATLSAEEILSRIQRWVHEDRAGFLVKTLVNAQASPAEIADAIRRYRHLVPAGTSLSEATLNTVRVNVIRRFLSNDPDYLRVAKEYVTLDDVLGLLERLVYLPGTHGRLGGKSAGLFLASQILARAAADGPDIGEVRLPRTWYVASDTVLGFISYNNLEEVFEQKYRPLEQVRLEYPNLVQVFKNAAFPPEIVNGLSMALDDLGDGPLIVRSSSLLEDRLGSAFSGKYKSLFLANRGSKRERLEALLDAIAEVYASIFSPDPIQYRAERGLLDVREEMGIMIQEVVGARVGRYVFPAFAGVAVSNNEFRWSSRIRREDGLIRLVPGLGTRAVDRLKDDYPILVAPGQPGLRVNVSADEVVRYSPQALDVVDLEGRSLATVGVREMLREVGESYPAARDVFSVLDDGRVVPPLDTIGDLDRQPVFVTFEGLLGRTPFVRRVGAILRALQERLGTPVEIEFASDGSDFHLLQCRPQTYATGSEAVPIPHDVPEDRVLFTANRYVSSGRVPDITHIVYVDPGAYEALTEVAELLAVGRAVGRLNALLPKRQFILMGPGRWGSRGDIRLGVNVTYSDINNAAMLLEIARRRGNYVPDLSFGTHFFQDLVESAIRYLPLYPDEAGVAFNERFFRHSPNALAQLLPEFAYLAEVIRVIDVPRATAGMVLNVLMNADLDQAVGLLGEPSGQAVQAAPRPAAEGVVAGDHWRWRLLMAERLAAQLDAERFGVEAIYLFGSSKNATAGPGSDIDLLVHFVGDDAQRAALSQWFEGWSLCLAEMNYLRTGVRSDGLLDVHLVTDRDIAERSSYAIKIGAVTDAARELSMKKPGSGDRDPGTGKD